MTHDEKKTDLTDSMPHKGTQTPTLVAKNLVGMYEQSKNHGVRQLYIEPEYALFIDQSGWGVINFSHIGTLEVKNDTIDFYVKYNFKNRDYFDLESNQNSSNQIDFLVYNDSIQKLQTRLFRFILDVDESDTMLIPISSDSFAGSKFRKI